LKGSVGGVSVGHEVRGYRMLIEISETQKGVDATAYFLCLFYTILRDGGISHDQTAFVHHSIEIEKYIDVEVSDGARPDVDEAFLRQGAMVALICELHDAFVEARMKETRQLIMLKVVESSSFAQSECVQALIRIFGGKQNEAALRRNLDLLYEEYVQRWWLAIGSAQNARTHS
jgi:hypothetical protein